MLLAAWLAILLVGCYWRQPTSTPAPTATRQPATPTPTATPTQTRAEMGPFGTYAHGELLPDMRIPLQHNKEGEGGWYVVILSADGWAQFLSRLGQPARIWEPVDWEQEILVGALLGVRTGRGHDITITGMQVDGLAARWSIAVTEPQPDPASAGWMAYPFHLIRVPRIELPPGPVTVEFIAEAGSETLPAGQILVSQAADLDQAEILWLPGEKATYPTPTVSPYTPLPSPVLTPTPVPNLQSVGTVLDVNPGTLELRFLPQQGDWVYVELMEATSILFESGQPAMVSQLAPGMTINVLGYQNEGERMRAAHIDILSQPPPDTELAVYQARDVTLATIYDGYTLPLAPETISSTVPVTMAFSLSQTHALTQNGFLVLPAQYDSFHALYSDPRGAGYPVFVSADAVLHATQAYLEQVQRSVELQYLLPELRMLDRELFARSWDQYQSLRDGVTPAEQRISATAQRNAAYFAVPLSLLDPTFVPPDEIAPLVRAELALIDAGQAITVSPLFDLPGLPDEEKLHVDYRLLGAAARAAAPERAAYARALAWHHGVILRPSQREETRSAALISYILHTDPAARVLWQRVWAGVSFFQGADASFTPLEYAALLGTTWGAEINPLMLADEMGMDTLTQAIYALPLPDHPLWTFWQKQGLPDRGWSWLPVPFEVESYVFAQLTGSKVGDGTQPRALPSAIDLTAVLGSLESYQVADEMGAAAYPNYLEQIGRVRNELAALPVNHWTGDLPWNWLHVQRALLEEKTPSYPEWMRSAAWRRKAIQTAAASWVHARQIQYAAAVSEPAAVPTSQAVGSERWGYVEPQPTVYARLAALVRQILTGLDARLMLTPEDTQTLLGLEEWLILMQDAARRELVGQALTQDEYARLGACGPGVAGLECPLRGTLVAWPAAAAEQETLIEASGWVDEIYVVIERGSTRYLARGGVYSHYEFSVPPGEAPSGSGWRDMLATGQAPARPGWMSRFLIGE